MQQGRRPPREVGGAPVVVRADPRGRAGGRQPRSRGLSAASTELRREYVR